MDYLLYFIFVNFKLVFASNCICSKVLIINLLVNWYKVHCPTNLLSMKDGTCINF